MPLSARDTYLLGCSSVVVLRVLCTRSVCVCVLWGVGVRMRVRLWRMFLWDLAERCKAQWACLWNCATWMYSITSKNIYRTCIQILYSQIQIQVRTYKVTSKYSTPLISYPAFSMSSLMATKPVARFPFRIFAEQNIHGPWHIAAKGRPKKKRNPIVTYFKWKQDLSWHAILYLLHTHTHTSMK